MSPNAQLVVIQLRADVSEATQGGQASAMANTAARRIEEAVRQLGGRLRPQHPGTDDPTLNRYFILEVVSADAAKQFLTELLGMDGVEAAYIKPQPALP